MHKDPLLTVLVFRIGLCEIGGFSGIFFEIKKEQGPILKIFMQFPFSLSNNRPRAGAELGIAGLVLLARIILQIDWKMPVKAAVLGELTFFSKKRNQAVAVDDFIRGSFCPDCLQKGG